MVVLLMRYRANPYLKDAEGSTLLCISLMYLLAVNSSHMPLLYTRAVYIKLQREGYMDVHIYMHGLQSVQCIELILFRLYLCDCMGLRKPGFHVQL